jgi:hypothetical protein
MQPDVSPAGSAGSAAPFQDPRIATTLDTWRRKLLDLGKRNRALNFRPARVSTVTIADEHPAEVFRRLYLDEKGMRFKPAPDTPRPRSVREPGPTSRPSGFHPRSTGKRS